MILQKIKNIPNNLRGTIMRPLQEAEQLPIDTNIEDLDEITDLEIGDLEESNHEIEETSEQKGSKQVKAHVIRRNVEDYLEQKALERRLSDVFETDYYLD